MPVLFELGMEGDRPEALLDETGLHFTSQRIGLRQVDKRFGQHLAVLTNYLDTSHALDHEDAA